jgi:hypothetical protein
MDQPHESTRAIATGAAQGIGFTAARWPVDECRSAAAADARGRADFGRVGAGSP